MAAEPYQVQVQRIGREGVQVYVVALASGLCQWHSPAIRWPLSPAGRYEFADAARHCPGLDVRWLEREVNRQLRGSGR